MSENIPEDNTAEWQQQIAQLKESIEGLITRVDALESKMKRDHETLTRDHDKIESLEATEKIANRPIGL